MAEVAECSDGDAGTAERGGDRSEVIWIAGEDLLVESLGNDHDTAVDDVGGTGLAQHAPDGACVLLGELAHLAPGKKPRQPRLGSIRHACASTVDGTVGRMP